MVPTLIKYKYTKSVYLLLKTILCNSKSVVQFTDFISQLKVVEDNYSHIRLNNTVLNWCCGHNCSCEPKFI